MSQQEGSSTVSFLCDFLGISRQGYYRHQDIQSELDVLRTSIILYCRWVRENQLPRAGMRELYALCVQRFGRKMTIGRDQCFDVFRSNGLVMRSRRRLRTTDSRHAFHIYSDLLNTNPRLVPQRCGELMVSDITYVATNTGWSYLSLVTDAASRLIIGYAMHPSLDTDGPLKALEMALAFYCSHGIPTEKLIHHSDRGIQYCSSRYVGRLKEQGIRISMTQTGDPLHNALAERMNNTIKNGWLFDCDELPPEEVKQKIAHAVDMYNSIRPHRSLGMMAPMEALRRKKESDGLPVTVSPAIGRAMGP